MVDILLATYNGAEYLREQIDSLLSQSFNDWRLIIRDDGSTDETLRIIESYVSKYPVKINLVKDNKIVKSAKHNFWSLLEHSDAEYVTFCDQDDIWFSNKIEQSLKAIQLEERKNPNFPILIHTDLTVVGENRSIINTSLYDMQNIEVSYFDRVERLLVQNAITGCTMMINRALAEKLKSIPNEAIMHDWWIALHAMIFGKIVYLKDSHILYRQHISNTVGAKDTRSIVYLTRQLRNVKAMKENIKQTYRQARALYEHLVITDVDPSLLYIIERYAKLIDENKITKIITIIRFGYLKNGLIRRIGQIFLC